MAVDRRARNKIVINYLKHIHVCIHLPGKEYMKTDELRKISF